MFKKIPFKIFIKNALRRHRKQYVFMVHHVLANPDMGMKRTISVNNLELFIIKCIKLIRSSNVQLTFDDGYSDIYTYVKPLLEKYGITCTIFICPSLIGSKGYLTKEELLKLADIGVSIQSHCYNHINMAEQDKITVFKELKESKNWIEQNVHSSCFAVAYPWGQYNVNSILAAKKLGYRKGYQAGEFRTLDYISFIYPLFSLCRTELTDDNFYQWIDIISKKKQ